jgi:hypothetical protein
MNFRNNENMVDKLMACGRQMASYILMEDLLF